MLREWVTMMALLIDTGSGFHIWLFILKNPDKQQTETLIRTVEAMASVTSLTCCNRSKLTMT